MNREEYERIKKLDYVGYCEYLQNKYGEGLGYYFTKSWTKNPKVSRTKEGLFVHHIYEGIVPRLSNKEDAVQHPYEFQAPETLVYCDFLEHLFLHVLISEEQIIGRGPILGLGGIINFIVPELNDVYSGWQPSQEWRKRTHEKIINDEDVYLELIKRTKEYCAKTFEDYTIEILLTSFNDDYGLWAKENNQKIFDKIISL